MGRMHSFHTRKYARDYPYATFVLEHREAIQYIGILTLVTMFTLFMAIFAAPAFAVEDEFADASRLIASGVSCNDLSDEELELIGDYYMEQMHPGELHEIMDQRLGGEGSENLRNVHINIAKRFYCGYFGMGMMGGGNMMNWGYNGYGMMGGGWMWLYSILILGILVLLAILLYQKVRQGGK